MKTSIVAGLAFVLSMIVFPVSAQNYGAQAMCSKQSIGLSIQWATQAATKAKALDNAKYPRPEKSDYFFPSKWRSNVLIWQNDQQLIATAAQTALLANDQMERLILHCEILKRLGLSS